MGEMLPEKHSDLLEDSSGSPSCILLLASPKQQLLIVDSTCIKVAKHEAAPQLHSLAVPSLKILYIFNIILHSSILLY